jgi:hypothetical protein
VPKRLDRISKIQSVASRTFINCKAATWFVDGYDTRNNKRLRRRGHHIGN